MIRRPFSYLYQAPQFPKEMDVWDRTGKTVHHIASLPLATGGRGGGLGPTDDPLAPPAAPTPRGTRASHLAHQRAGHPDVDRVHRDRRPARHPPAARRAAAPAAAMHAAPPAPSTCWR